MKHYPNIKKANLLYGISVICFFSALHISIPSYFNSSFLSTFADERTISLIYLIVSIVTILGLLLMDKILIKLGNLRTSLLFTMAQMLIFYGLLKNTDPNIITVLFIIQMSLVSLITFNIDIFIQRSSDMGHTGSIRGLTMTAVNMGWILGPLIGGLLLNGDNKIEDFRGIYIAGLSMLFPILYLILKNFKDFKDPKYREISAIETFIKILKNPDISKIFIINIALQSFYAWMTVYIPLYLHNTIGFSWTEISLIFTIMLIPFVLVELPLGKLADKKFGEKEIMAVGFTILGISTMSLILFTSKNVALWAGLLFLTRIGAAAAEIMIETYFFKKIDGRDPEILSLFRITRPLSYFVAPLIVTISLVYTSEPYLFLVFGTLILLNLYPILSIKDTK